MQTRLVTSIGVALCSTILLAQTLPPTTPHRSSYGYLDLPFEGGMEIRKFQLDGVQYGSFLSHQVIRNGPEWVPASAVPLGVAKAEELARRELRKLVKDDSLWSVSEFQIVRCPKAAESRWFYAIVFASVIELRGEKSETATILVTLGGKVAPVRTYGVANVARER
jgi:hypothetical protein